MSNRKRTQHRAKRDTTNKENTTLKQTVRDLKRQVQRLKKQIVQESFISEVEEITQKTILRENNAVVCPKCGSNNTASLRLPNGSMAWGCKNCKQWKKVNGRQ